MTTGDERRRQGRTLIGAVSAQGFAGQGPGADCLQRPLRSRFRQQLRPGVRTLTEKDGSVITGSLNLTLEPVTIQATGRTRVNLSVPHLLSACLFSRQVRELEEENRGRELGAFWEPILAHATANVLLTVAALESYVNELFSDHDTNFPGFRTDILVKLWASYELKCIIDKFDLALLLREAGSLDRGISPTQDVALLIRLRNALTHFKPEWFDEQQEHAKLSARLAGRFSPSVFFQGEPIFPRGWATHGCTAWAVKSAIHFIGGFESQAGLPKRLEKFKSRFLYE